MREYVYLAVGVVVAGMGFWYVLDRKAPEFIIPSILAVLLWPVYGLLALGWYLASKTKDSR